MAHPLVHLMPGWWWAGIAVRSDGSSRARSRTPKPCPSGSRHRSQAPLGAGMTDYLKEAFFFRWNLLFFLGGLAGAAMTPMSDVMMPLVAAGELTLPGRAHVDSALSRRHRREGPRGARERRQPARHAGRRRRSCRCSKGFRPTPASGSSGFTRAAWRCARSPSGVRGAAGDRERIGGGDPDARPRSAAVALSPAADVEGRARSLPGRR